MLEQMVGEKRLFMLRAVVVVMHAGGGECLFSSVHISANDKA